MIALVMLVLAKEPRLESTPYANRIWGGYTAALAPPPHLTFKASENTVLSSSSRHLSLYHSWLVVYADFPMNSHGTNLNVNNKHGHSK